MRPSTPTVSVRDPFISEARGRVCRGGAGVGNGGRGGSGDALAVARDGEGTVLNNGEAESELFSHTQHAHALTFTRRDLSMGAKQKGTRSGNRTSGRSGCGRERRGMRG